MDNMIRVGIIGAGHWGINYIRNFLNFTDCDLVDCCDISEERRAYVRKIWPFLSTTGDVDDLLQSDTINAIVISTPAGTHFRLAKKSLLSGKHVMLEKPFTLHEGEGQELVSIAEQRQLTLMVGHTFLYNAAIQKLKQYIECEDFGDIYYLHSTRTHLGLIRDDVNAVWDLAPHDISIFTYLLNMQPVQVSAVGSRCLGNGREDVVFINLIYPQRIIGHIQVSWIDSHKVREVTVVGSKKRIVFNDLDNLETIKIYEKGITAERPVRDFGEFHYILRDGDIISPKIHLTEPLANQCRHFIDCIHQHSKPLSDGHSAVNVVKVLNAIDESMAENGRPVYV